METGEWPREFATQITSVHIAARIGSSWMQRCDRYGRGHKVFFAFAYAYAKINW
jgi:hypothetical protein